MSVTRRDFFYFSSAALTVLSRTGTLLAQGQTPQTSFEDIRRNVGIFNGSGGTIGWLSNKEALVVVDAQYANTARICLDGLHERAARKVDLLFNTHHHGDHTGGNGVFRPEVKKIIAHVRVPELLKEQAATAKADTSPPVLPDTTFERTWSEKAGDEQITARYYGPGHTGGDAIVHFQRANVVHMGDLLFLERHPFIDRPAGASIQSWMRVLDAVAKGYPRDTVYIAGHARQGLSALTDRAALLAFRDYFDAVLTETRRAIKEGKSKEELAKLEALKGFEGYQSSGARLSLAGSLGVAYDELTQK
jgi:glyoxylase-like metal-dependent hydrolase (beta-lactamase superfamily II)